MLMVVCLVVIMLLIELEPAGIVPAGFFYCSLGVGVARLRLGALLRGDYSLVKGPCGY